MNPVSIIPAPWAEPAAVAAAFRDEPWRLAFLSDGAGERGRWSYVLGEPEAVLMLTPDDPRDAFRALSSLLGEADAEVDPDGPPFQGGVAGLAAYELGDRVEPVGLARLEPWPDLACARYETLLAFDHANRTVLAIGRGEGAQAKARRALSWLDEPVPPKAGGPLAAALCVAPGPIYEQAVAEVVEKITAGEIFQANIARRWTGRLSDGAHPFDIARRLASASFAPFAAWMRLPGLAVVSNSPERFVRLRRGADGRFEAESRPIKGTRPRGGDPAEDARLARDLASSEKDRAENLMIVDLMRNDLARVCRPGGVTVPQLCRVESFANVHHLVSAVRGELAPGRTGIDLLRAAFPPGSITGAPKVQAMRVIAALEAPRGPFFGSMFWIGADGPMDSSVLIRTAAFVQDPMGWHVETRAGAGIVADSQPGDERAETETKISAVLRAFEQAE